MIPYQVITVELAPKHLPPAQLLTASQYDNGRPIKVMLTNGGTAYNLPAGVTAHIQVLKPSGKIVIDNAEVSTGTNAVIFTLTQQMTAEYGQTLMQLSLTGEGQDPLGTANWIGYIEKSPTHGDPSETWIVDLNEAVDQAMDAAESAEQSVLDSEAWAVGKRGGVPVTDVDPTYHNNAKYYAGQADESAQSAASSSSDASGYADAAGQSAINAAGSASDASGYADNASASAGEASGSATEAAGSARDAAGSALDASGYANNAGRSALDAADSAGAAAGSANSASGSASSASANALKSEGFAVGEQDGTEVESGSPYYHNNAEYYAGEASGSAASASDSAGAASGSASTSGTQALKSEGYAIGTQGGTPVASGSPYYEYNSKYFADEAAAVAASIPEDYFELIEDVSDLKSAIDGISEETEENLVNEANLLNIQDATYANGWYSFKPSKASTLYGTDSFPNRGFKANTQYTLSFDAKYTGEQNSGAILRFTYTDNTKSNCTIYGSAEDHYSLTSTSGKTIAALNISYNNDVLTDIKNLMVVEGTTEPESFVPYDDRTAVDTVAREQIAADETVIASVSVVADGAATAIANVSENFTVNLVDEANFLNIQDATYADGWYSFKPSKGNALYGTTSFPNRGLESNKQYTMSFDAKYTGTATSTLIIRFKYSDNTQTNCIVTGSTETHYAVTSTLGKTVSAINISYNNDTLTYVKHFMVVEGAIEPSEFIPYDAKTAIDATARMEIANQIKPLLNKKHLTILVFGNSYSADSWQYVPFILKKYGITCEIYLYYRGNDSIDRLVAEWEETSDYGTDAWGIQHIRRMCHVDTRYSDKWDSNAGVTGYSPKMCVELANDPNIGFDKWDLITLQTAPTECYFTKSVGNGDPRKGYEPYFRQAIDLINASYSKDYMLGLFTVYTRILAYPGNVGMGYPAVTSEAFDNRVDCLRAQESLYYNEPFNVVIPAAAAVFNARTNAELASSDVSDIGNLWYSDQIHLQDGIPCYITNLTVIQSLFNTFFPGLSVMGEQTRLTDNMIIGWNGLMPSIHGRVINSDEELYDLAQKAAVAACEHPFDITPIYSPDDTTEMEFHDTQTRYWADGLIDTTETMALIAEL